MATDFMKWKRENRPEQYRRELVENAEESLARAHEVLEDVKKWQKRRKFRIEK